MKARKNSNIVKLTNYKGQVDLGKKVWSRWAKNFVSRVLQGKPPVPMTKVVGRLLEGLHEVYPTESGQRHNITLNTPAEDSTLVINVVHKDLWWSVGLDPFDLEKGTTRLLKEIRQVIEESLVANKEQAAEILDSIEEDESDEGDGGDEGKEPNAVRPKRQPQAKARSSKDGDEDLITYAISKPSGHGRWAVKVAPTKSLKEARSFKGAGGDFIVRVVMRKEAVISRKPVYVWTEGAGWKKVKDVVSNEA